MTKDGSFKRAVRTRARATGEKYTQARAAMENDLLRERIARPVQHEALKAHLEARYGINITSLKVFDVDHPATLIVDRSDGPAWVARVFSSTADSVERVEADAEILRWLATKGYPAERLAHPEPVSLLEQAGVAAASGDEHRFGSSRTMSVPVGTGVLVTELVQGTRFPSSPGVQGRLGDLLGRLHAMPLAPGAVARDGGSFDHDPAHCGRPSCDLAAALNFLDTVQYRVDPERRDKFDWLRDQVLSADDCEGLPEAFTHANYGDFNAIQSSDGELVIVGWSASGRAPRLPALAWLLFCSGGGAEQIDAITRAYARHVQVADEELDRLEGALMIRYLYLSCWYYWTSVSSGYTPSGGEGWWPDPAYAGRIAERAIAAFRGGAK